MATKQKSAAAFRRELADNASLTEVKRLEIFVDESIRRCQAADPPHNPTRFIKMQRLGTISAIKELVIAGDIQSGFRRMEDCGLLDWSIEAAVLAFPALFKPAEVACAKWRLEEVKQPA